MSQPRATFNKDHEEIVQKFSRLIQAGEEFAAQIREYKDGGGQGAYEAGTDGIKRFYAVRTSALNLLSRVSGTRSVYYRALRDDRSVEKGIMTPGIVIGVLNAAMTDYREGFMADSKLLVSAEVFADFLVQAEVLLEHDYKDAAAVIIRAVLEDGLRRVCLAKGIVVKERAGVDDLAQALTKQNLLTAVQKKEIDAKREIGNAAAHGRFSEFTKQDVLAFHEFVQRLLATLI